MFGIFLDTEANGLDPKKHHVIEIAFKIINLTNGALKDAYQSIVAISEEEFQESNPKSLKVNGFNYEMIRQGQKKSLVQEQIVNCFKTNVLTNENSVFICQNPSFDRTFFSELIEIETQQALSWPYHWLDLASMFWSKTIFLAKKSHSDLPWQIGLSKDDIAEYYRLPKEKTPHKAMNGVEHLILCYESVVGYIN